MSERSIRSAKVSEAERYFTVLTLAAMGNRANNARAYSAPLLARGFSSLQSRQAWARLRGPRLAVFNVSSLRSHRSVSKEWAGAALPKAVIPNRTSNPRGHGAPYAWWPMMAGLAII